jgi:hypothetical protein
MLEHHHARPSSLLAFSGRGYVNCCRYRAGLRSSWRVRGEKEVNETPRFPDGLSVPASPPKMRGWTTRTFYIYLISDHIAFLALRRHVSGHRRVSHKSERLCNS